MYVVIHEPPTAETEVRYFQAATAARKYFNQFPYQAYLAEVTDRKEMPA